MCNVLIGGTADENKYCSQCAKAAEYLIDGACVTEVGSSGCATPESSSDSTLAGTCKSCAANYFLYKGGCYNSKGDPGQAICTNAPAGVCDTPVSGYFVVPGAAKTDQSVAACGDATTGVTIGGNKKYVGVDGCTKCTKPELLSEAGTKAATCEACSAQESTPRIVKTAAGVTSCVTEAQCTGAEGFFVKGQGGSKTCEACSDATKGGVKGCTACAANADTPDQAKCTACTLPKKPSQNGRNCYNCDINGCMYCSANDACEACVSGKILKTDGSTKTCVAEAECTAGFFVSTASDVKTCISCTDNSNGVPDCATCEARADNKAKAKCLSCTGTKKPKMDGTQCNECDIPGCTNCDTASQCAVCGDGYRHDANTCQKCTPEHCKACANDVNTCTECASGYKLEGGKCASSSTNRSGLSSGAIAGISVAAVVVVGGLVGFLCWWFICRGKA